MGCGSRRNHGIRSSFSQRLRYLFNGILVADIVPDRVGFEGMRLGQKAAFRSLAPPHGYNVGGQLGAFKFGRCLVVPGFAGIDQSAVFQITGVGHGVAAAAAEDVVDAGILDIVGFGQRGGPHRSDLCRRLGAVVRFEMHCCVCILFGSVNRLLRSAIVRL